MEKEFNNKRLSTEKKIFIILGICLVAGVLGIHYLLILSENVKCVKDEYDGKKLIQHYDIDTNIAKLEISENGKSRWIKHPNCCMEMSPLVCGDMMEFDRNDENKIIINDTDFLIEFISKEEAEKLGRESINKK